MARTAKLPATKRPATKLPAKVIGKALSDISSPEWIARRNAAIIKQERSREIDFGAPTAPSGHEYGVRTSSRLIRQFRELHRKLAMDITPQPVIDIMLPWAEFQQTILKDFVITEKKTKHRIPTLEAAIVAKFVAMVSVMRRYERKEQDAVDFRRMVRANFDLINRESLRHLAGQVWKEGADKIERFLDIAMSNKPFAL